MPASSAFWPLFGEAFSIRWTRNLSIRMGSWPLSILMFRRSYSSSEPSADGFSSSSLSFSCCMVEICAKVRFSNFAAMQTVVFKDLGEMPYQQAWDYQESLLKANVQIKSAGGGDETTHYLLFVEHPPVYTLGKSGHEENVLINE